MARAILFGTSVSPGIALGKVQLIHPSGTVEERHIRPEECDAEVAALLEAAARAREELQQASEQVPADLSEQCDIIRAHMQLCQDPKLLGAAQKRIREQHLCAAWALASTVEELCALFRGMNDPYLRERAQDIKAVGQRLQAGLQGGAHVRSLHAAPHILMAEDISPADALSLNLRGMLGLVTMEGGPTSHTAILARSLHLPAVVGVTSLLNTVEDGDFVIVDAVKGCIYIAPDEEEMALFAVKQEEYQAWEHNTRHNAPLPAETLDGVRVSVQANLENPDECGAALSSGAEGAGLYRTEFAYLRSAHLPTEEQ